MPLLQLESESFLRHKWKLFVKVVWKIAKKNKKTHLNKLNFTLSNCRYMPWTAIAALVVSRVGKHERTLHWFLVRSKQGRNKGTFPTYIGSQPNQTIPVRLFACWWGSTLRSSWKQARRLKKMVDWRTKRNKKQNIFLARGYADPGQSLGHR